MGRPLRAGETITLVVKNDWLDARACRSPRSSGAYYRVGAADERALDTVGVARGAARGGHAGARDVTFPKALDHGLLQRALGVTRIGTPVPGNAGSTTRQTRWRFAPRDAWQAGDYTVEVLPILEDVAGNRIGRAFEVTSSPSGARARRERPADLAAISNSLILGV